MVVKRNIHKANDLPNSPENPVDVRDINSEAIKERLYMIALDENGNLRVVLARNGMEYYGASIEDRPAPDSVPVGAAFMIVGTTNIWQSNGTDWVVI